MSAFWTQVPSLGSPSSSGPTSHPLPASLLLSPAPGARNLMSPFSSQDLAEVTSWGTVSSSVEWLSSPSGLWELTNFPGLEINGRHAEGAGPAGSRDDEDLQRPPVPAQVTFAGDLPSGHRGAIP